MTKEEDLTKDNSSSIIHHPSPNSYKYVSPENLLAEVQTGEKVITSDKKISPKTKMKVDANSLLTNVEKELDEKYIFIEEKTIMKTYSLDINAINPFLVKNKKDNFIGWNIISFKELNNRLYYNYNEIINNHNRLESSDISNLLEKKDI